MVNPIFIMIHHSGVSYNANSDQFKASNSYHKSLGFPKSSLGYYVGYNYEIAKNGRVRQSRLPGEVTAACYQEGMNSGKCVHICLDGNFNKDQDGELAEFQVYALRDLIRDLILKHDIKEIYFHRDFANKDCPGNNLDKAWIKKLSKFNPKKKDKNTEIIGLLEKVIKLISEYYLCTTFILVYKASFNWGLYDMLDSIIFMV